LCRRLSGFPIPLRFSSGSPAVRRRGLDAGGSCCAGAPRLCARNFFVSQGVFCKLGTAVPCLDVSSVPSLFP
jgi:hypothetical protein